MNIDDLLNPEKLSFWKHEGRDDALDGYTVIGHDDDTNERLMIYSYDSFLGAESIVLNDEAEVDPRWIMSHEKATELCSRIAVKDNTMWPPFNPKVARVINRKVMLEDQS